MQPHTPVIVMSASASVLASAAFGAGAFDVLPKPFPQESLIASFCQALRAHTIRRDLEAADRRLCRLQQRLAIQQSDICSLQGKARQLLLIAESVIRCSRVTAAHNHTKTLIHEMEKRMRVVEEALRAIRENARQAALRRVAARG